MPRKDYFEKTNENKALMLLLTWSYALGTKEKLDPGTSFAVKES